MGLQLSTPSLHFLLHYSNSLLHHSISYSITPTFYSNSLLHHSNSLLHHSISYSITPFPTPSLQPSTPSLHFLLHHSNSLLHHSISYSITPTLLHHSISSSTTPNLYSMIPFPTP